MKECSVDMHGVRCAAMAATLPTTSSGLHRAPRAQQDVDMTVFLHFQQNSSKISQQRQLQNINNNTVVVVVGS